MTPPTSPFSPIALRLLSTPDSHLKAFLDEAHRLVAERPALVAAVEADLDAHARQKEALRVADAAWVAAQTAPLPGHTSAPTVWSIPAIVVANADLRRVLITPLAAAPTPHRNRTYSVVQIYKTNFEDSVVWDSLPIMANAWPANTVDTDGSGCDGCSFRISLIAVPDWGTDLGGNFYGNPGFRDPKHGDYHLTQGSPAIDRAVVDALPLVDADFLALHDDRGTPNLGSGAVAYGDVGPYEFQGTTTLWLDEPVTQQTWIAGEQRAVRWHRHRRAPARRGPLGAARYRHFSDRRDLDRHRAGRPARMDSRAPRGHDGPVGRRGPAAEVGGAVGRA